MLFILQLLRAATWSMQLPLIKAGKPVYIEKPMALNYAECLRIIETAEQYNVPVFVAYYRRALPGFLMVKEMIESGSHWQGPFPSYSALQEPLRR